MCLVVNGWNKKMRRKRGFETSCIPEWFRGFSETKAWRKWKSQPWLAEGKAFPITRQAKVLAVLPVWGKQGGQQLLRGWGGWRGKEEIVKVAGIRGTGMDVGQARPGDHHEKRFLLPEWDGNLLMYRKYITFFWRSHDELSEERWIITNFNAPSYTVFQTKSNHIYLL